MPHSALEGRGVMLDWIKARLPRSILDIGAGSGTYGVALRSEYRLWTGYPYMIAVEIWRPYVKSFGLNEIYDYVITKDVRHMTGIDWPRVDVVIFGDVLEHMTEDEAVRVWNLARCAARRAVYLSIPTVPCPQDEEHGNPYERHVVADWTHERVMLKFPGITQHWNGTVVSRYEAELS